MSDDTGSWFPVPEESELPDRLRGLFAKARETLGFVPNVFRVWAYRPERLSASARGSSTFAACTCRRRGSRSPTASSSPSS